MEHLQDRFRSAHTQVLGVSVDSKFCHAGWAKALGGISYPLLADFNPKGEMAQKYGLYLDEAGITDRATVIIDSSGIVRHASSVTPAGSRDISALAALCEEIDAKQGAGLKAIPAPAGIAGQLTLYIKSKCGFSSWALQALANLHLEDQIPVNNLSEDALAAAQLKQIGGKEQVPCLVAGEQAIYESADIISYLTKRVTDIQ